MEISRRRGEQMLPKEARKVFLFFCGTLSAASLVPRERCGGEEDKGGAIKKEKENLGQHVDGGCECVWEGLLHHT